MAVAPQIFVRNDPLYDFKKGLNKAHPKCQLFIHNDVNGPLKISSGRLYRQEVKEKFLTDGTISLERYSREPAFIVWREAVLTLDDHISFDFNLEDASFFIYDLSYGYERRFEIHTSLESTAIYEKIITYLLEREKLEGTLNSIRFSSLRTLEQVIQKQHQKIVMDTKTGKEKVYKI